MKIKKEGNRYLLDLTSKEFDRLTACLALYGNNLHNNYHYVDKDGIQKSHPMGSESKKDLSFLSRLLVSAKNLY